MALSKKIGYMSGYMNAFKNKIIVYIILYTYKINFFSSLILTIGTFAFNLSYILGVGSYFKNYITSVLICFFSYTTLSYSYLNLW